MFPKDGPGRPEDVKAKDWPYLLVTWQAIHAYYATNTVVPLTRTLLRPEFNKIGAGSLSKLDDLLRDYRDKGYIWWPVERGEMPPWEKPQLDDTRQAVIDLSFIPKKRADRPAPAPTPEAHLVGSLDLGPDGEHMLVEAWVDDDGVFHLIRHLPAVAIAAGLAAMITLDGLDGHVDHIIHWCRVLLHMHFGTVIG